MLDFYIIAIATITNNDSKIPMHLNRVGIHYYQPNDLISINGNLVPELVYHRIDLIPIHSPLCKYFMQLATMGNSIKIIVKLNFDIHFFFLILQTALRYF